MFSFSRFLLMPKPPVVVEAICCGSVLLNMISYVLFLDEFNNLLIEEGMESLHQFRGEEILFLIMYYQEAAFPIIVNILSLAVFALSGAWIIGSHYPKSISDYSSPWIGNLLLYTALALFNFNFYLCRQMMARAVTEAIRNDEYVSLDKVQTAFFFFSILGFVIAILAGYAVVFRLHGTWPTHIFPNRTFVLFLTFVLGISAMVYGIHIQLVLLETQPMTGIVSGAIAIVLMFAVYAYTRFYLAKDDAGPPKEREPLIVQGVVAELHDDV